MGPGSTPAADAIIERVKALEAKPHRRYDPLRDAWVLVSPGRTRRPWVGAVEEADEVGRPPYDPDCYLCPGNRRAGGEANPRYESTYVFTNDFAALQPDTPSAALNGPLIRAEGLPGTCRVVCFSPRHDLSFGELSPAAARAVVDVWADQSVELGQTYASVQVFENRGQTMGASNPHPHGQIWAASALPNEAVTEQRTQAAYLRETGRPMLTDYAGFEAEGPRAVYANEGWLVVVPYWAVWPFETLVLPRWPVARLSDTTHGARDQLVEALHELVARYDALFNVPFPYSMGWHQAPSGTDEPGWTVHAHYYPPLLRSATVRKFMVGYELLAEPQRDITAEEAAALLRGAHRRPAGGRAGVTG